MNPRAPDLTDEACARIKAQAVKNSKTPTPLMLYLAYPRQKP